MSPLRAFLFKRRRNLPRIHGDESLEL